LKWRCAILEGAVSRGWNGGGPEWGWLMLLVVYIANAGGHGTGDLGYCLGGRDTEPFSRLIDESVVEKTRPFERHVVLHDLMLLVPRNPRIDHHGKCCVEKAGGEGDNGTGSRNVAMSCKFDNLVRFWEA